MHKIEFEDGVKVRDTKRKSAKKHGVIAKFSPSQKYLGKTAHIPRKELVEWITKISYFIPTKCKITLDIVKGSEVVERMKFKKKPLIDLLNNYVAGDKLTADVMIERSTQMTEDVTDLKGKSKTIYRDLSVQVAFAYTNALEAYVDSYCNYINTTNGGAHLNAVKESIWRYFTKKLNEIMSDKERERYKILKVDVEQGLNLIVNLSTDMQMQLVGQTKNEVGNDELVDPIKRITTEGLEAFFDNHKTELDAILKVIKLNCKARIDAAKVKASALKVSYNDLDKFMERKFTPCNNKGKQYKELLLVEGGSAARSIVEARDPDTQAVLELRGVTANAQKRTAATILENAEWKKYVDILHTNWGPKYDPIKCYYDKILIMTDSDIDGLGITSGICNFHVWYMPEIIRDGRLYKCIAPLYKLDDKKHPFARNKLEYVEVYQDKIIAGYKIAILEISDKNIGKSEFKEFIYDTEEYSEQVLRISKYYKVNKFFIERIAAFVASHPSIKGEPVNLFKGKMYTEFMEWLQLMFPEMKSNGKQMLRGVIEGRTQSIKINERFFKKIEPLIPIYEKYGYALRVTEKNSDPIVVSILQFLDMSSKYKSRIITRFKGLGEANAEDLWDTTLNPDTRILIQYTMDDYEKALDTFRVLHGQSAKDSRRRKEMMKAYTINRNDLDN